MYFGTTADGSDIKEFKGFYVSENGKFFGNKPVAINFIHCCTQCLEKRPLFLIKNKTRKDDKNNE